MIVGEQMQVDIIANGKRTGEKRDVEVVAIKRDHVTQRARSVRVRTLKGAPKTVWVQPQFLSTYTGPVDA